MMKRCWLILNGLILLLSSSLTWAQTQTHPLLNNRFRVDPTIKQASFIIYREQDSQAAILVRPDGTKYYAWKHPEHIVWYEENGMDIVSIKEPMPGPWQAIGAISEKNKIEIVSNLQLSAAPLAHRLYQHERIKFQAYLTQNEQPIVLRDFLDRVNLKVTFTPFVANEDQLTAEAKPIPITAGEFLDDGIGLDEVAGDGKFTVELPIEVAPGKYRARITSGNGVFLRAIEQEVLVYPSPVVLEFTQSRNDNPHRARFDSEKATIEPGSLSASVIFSAPEDYNQAFTKAAFKDANHINIAIPISGQFGTHKLESKVFATDAGSGRELVFELSPVNFGVMQEVDLTETQERLRQAKLQQQREEMLLALEKQREQSRQKTLLVIVGVNVLVIILGVVIVLVVRRRRKQQQDEPELQLNAPPS